jgi:diguanylate cyclase (GGDEF)-like protein
MTITQNLQPPVNAPGDVSCTHPDVRSIRFSRHGVSEGLSQSTVNHIMRDRYGVMWLGTQNGLNHYNGYEFAAFHHSADNPRSVSSNSMNTLAEDRQGYLWIATGKGLSRFDQGTQLFDTFLVDSPDDVSFSTNTFHTMLVDPDCSTTLWLGSAYGLLSFCTDSLRFAHHVISGQGLPPSANQVRCLADDGEGALWLGTFGAGLFRFDKHTRTFSQPVAVDLGLRVTSLHAHSAGQFLVGTEKQGLFVLDTGAVEVTPHGDATLFAALAGSLITTFGRDAHDRLWIGTSDRGVVVYCPHCSEASVLYHDRFDPDGLPSNWVRSIFLDPRGRVWVGTLTGGVSIYDPGKYKFRHVHGLPSRPESLGGNVVRGFCRDRLGRLWVGTESGLNRLDDSQQSFVQYTSLDEDDSTINSNLVRGLYVDRAGEMWVFTWHGICRYDYDTDSFVRVSLPEGSGTPIRSTDLRYRYLDSLGGEWYGTEIGLVHFLPDGTMSLYDSHQDNPLRIIGDRQRFFFETSDGRLLLSTMSGHCSVNLRDGEIINYGYSRAADAPMTRYFILCYHEDETDLWYGVMGGLFRQNKRDRSWRSYGMATGFPNDVIYGILPDDEGHLWLSTNRGLVCFDPDQECCRSYELSDGLQAYEFNNNAYFRDNAGYMYFGGVNGYNVFHPRDIVDDQGSIDLIFTGFSISGLDLRYARQVAEGGVLHVPYSARSIDISFTALEYSHPSKIHYAYQLVGVDGQWVYCEDSRTASYRNLPPGDHLFRVRSTNRDRVWCENTISLLVKVEQPQWLMRLGEGALGQADSSELRQYLEDIEVRSAQLELEKEQLSRLSQTLLHAAFHDALTGVYNRAGYMQVLERFLTESRLPLGLIIVDVDGLKLVNDNLGHAEGDVLIRRAADKLAQCSFSTDSVVARVGGDEFALLIANCSRDELARACSLIGCGEAERLDSSQQDFLSLSSGCAYSDDVPLNQLFTTADERMYQFKRAHGEAARESVLAYIRVRAEQMGETGSGAISTSRVPR